MKLDKIIFSSLKSMERNLMRAMLTTLGIMIGIASVITMMAIGQGSSYSIQKSIASMGANTIIVFPGSANNAGVTFGSGSLKTLTPQDSDAIRKECPSVLDAAPVIQSRTQVVYGNKNWVPSSIYGTTLDYLDVQNWKQLSKGRVFSDSDVMNANRVCLVGQTIVKELFNGKSPIGKEIRIMNVPFKVIGVLKPKGANMMGMDQDDVVLAPWTSIKYRVANSSLSNTNQSSTSSSTSSTSSRGLYSNSETDFYPEQSESRISNHLLYARFANIDQIVLSGRSSNEVSKAIQEITKVLKIRHHIEDGAENDFTIRSLSELEESLSSSTKAITRLLLCVSIISLVIGGIGIMNIMLVCVSERTREIGLRMSVGAKQYDILSQFLMEAVLMCITGGIVGVLLGSGSSLLVEHVLKWPIMISWGAITLAVAVSVSVGVIFGYYPAWKASRLDPIEALRYE